MSRSGLDGRSRELALARVPFVHARVVWAQRPTSAKPGDEAVVFADGTIEGFVGGTCAESTVRAQAIALLDTGEPLLLRISPSADEAVANSDEDGSLTVHNPCLSGGTLEIFLEPVLPQPVLAVHGDSPIARALAAVGEPVGFAVTAWGSPGAAAGDVAAVVVASHGRDEEDVLAEALRACVPYVGLVASRKRGAAVLTALDVDEEQRVRVHTPAGLDIGARTPDEVALSILAEIIADRARPSGRPVEQHRSEAPADTATDPVCGMSVAAVEASLHLDRDGHREYFCGSGCLRAFSADPAAYVET